MTEFSTARQKLMSAVSTRVMFSMKWPSGMGDGMGFCAIDDDVLDDSRNA